METPSQQQCVPKLIDNDEYHYPSLKTIVDTLSLGQVKVNQVSYTFPRIGTKKTYINIHVQKCSPRIKNMRPSKPLQSPINIAT